MMIGTKTYQVTWIVYLVDSCSIGKSGYWPDMCNLYMPIILTNNTLVKLVVSTCEEPYMVSPAGFFRSLYISNCQ